MFLKDKVFNFRVFFCAFLVLSVSGIVSCKDSSQTYVFITEDDVEAIMLEVEIATQNRDIDNVVKYMSPSVVINITVDAPQGTRKVRWSRQQYKKETKKSWAMISDYVYKRENDKISISDDGQSAVVESEVFESMSVQGQTLKAETHEKVFLEIIDGELLVTQLDGYIKM